MREMGSKKGTLLTMCCIVHSIGLSSLRATRCTLDRVACKIVRRCNEHNR